MSEERKHKTQTDWVVQILRDAIIKGEMKPGEKLRQEGLAQNLGISPTPIREAFRRLEVEGLLVHLPHKGVRVVEFSIEDAEEVCLIRSVLEGLATRLAVQGLNADARDSLADRLASLQDEMEACLGEGNHERLAELHEEYHMSLYNAANSPRLLQLITIFRLNYPQDTLWVIPGRAEDSMHEHRDLLDSVREGDAQLAETLVRMHLERSMIALVDHLRNSKTNSDLISGLEDANVMKGGEITG